MSTWRDLEDNIEEEQTNTDMDVDGWGDDIHAYNKKIAKLEKWNEFLAKQSYDMVLEVGQLFDWHDGKVQHMEHENATKHAEDVKTKLAEIEEQCKMELKMEKMRLANEQRCILSSQADIIRNTRKAMMKVKEDMDVHQKEKKNLESVIAELLKSGHGSKEKLHKIKSILEEWGGCLETKSTDLSL
ncbi:hypothetical protein D1007_36680 [Hordeum vulgare]|nr:hypothetical protein D1007_36680 [Hordeum vulgare]